MRVQSNGKTQRDAGEKRRIFERYRRSGLSDAAFCRKEKLSKNTLAKWKRGLSQLLPVAPRFIELTPRSEVEAAASAEFELSFPGGVTLRWKA